MTAAAAAAPASAVQAALNSIGSRAAGIPLRTAVSYATVGGGRPARTCGRWPNSTRACCAAASGLAGGEVDVLLQSADGTKIEQRTARWPAASAR